MTQRRLLVIAHSYSNFVKGPTDEMASYYRDISVFVRLNPFAELYSLIPFQFLQPYTRSVKIDYSRQPQNVRVIETPVWYLPFDATYKRIGLKHYRVVDHYLKRSKSAFDLIHAHFTYSAGFAAARLKEQHGIPFVLTAHGYDVYSLPFRDPTWNEIVTGVLDAADQIITVSASNLHAIRRLGINKPVAIIPNGFDSRRFFPADMAQCRHQLQLPEQDKIVISVGNLYPVKGHTYLIESIKHLVDEGTNMKCYIIGSGTRRSSLAKQIQHLDLSDHVILTGAVAHADIPLWINASDFFVLPSLSEGNPTVMFETLGCGKPFIGTTVGGIPEIISSRDYGLLAEPANPEMLATRMQEAFDTRWDRDRIVKYAQKFTWKQIACDIMDIHRMAGGIDETQTSP
jgi:glycosyltransferase involved in cell wall biosynthesis